jgi:hypothetical protein
MYEEFSKKEPKVEIEYWDNGQKESEEWYLNGKLHREDGPSYQRWYKDGQKEYERWRLNDKLHREDGPAIQYWYSNGQKKYENWFLNNKFYSRGEWVEKLKEIGSPHYGEQKMLLDAEKYNL